MAILCAAFYAAVAIVILLVLAEAVWSVGRRPPWEKSREFDTWRARARLAAASEPVKDPAWNVVLDPA